jgi:hypothetical protein
MKKLFSLITGLLAINTLPAGVFTNSVSVDSFVRANAPTLNYGGAGALSVSGTDAVNGSGVTNGAFDSFIRFNTTAMVTSFNSSFGTNNWAISSARLRVTEIAAPPQALFNRGVGAFEIRWIANDNWTEGTGNPTTPATSGIVYTNETSLLNSLTDASLGIFTNAGADVTQSFPLALPPPFVTDLNSGGEVGLFLTARDAGIGFTFDARSFGTVTARPYLEVAALPRPGIAGITLSGVDILLSVTNGVAGGNYFVFTSTNISQPVSAWLPVATNVPLVNGSFSVTVTNGMSAPQNFFLLEAQ